MPLRRKYFWARISTATWDQDSGTITSLASNTTVPSSLVMRLMRGTKGIPSSASWPTLVKWREIFMGAPGTTKRRRGQALRRKTLKLNVEWASGSEAMGTNRKRLCRIERITPRSSGVKARQLYFFNPFIGLGNARLTNAWIRNLLSSRQAGPHASAPVEPGQVGRSSHKTKGRVPWKARPIFCLRQTISRTPFRAEFSTPGPILFPLLKFQTVTLISTGFLKVSYSGEVRSTFSCSSFTCLVVPLQFRFTFTRICVSPGRTLLLSSRNP